MADILTPCLVKKLYLQGVRETDRDGNPLPDEFYQAFIDSGISLLEHKTDLILTGSQDVVHSELKDSFNWFAEIQWLMNLTKRPVASVTEFAIQWGNWPEFTIDVSRIKLRDTPSADGGFNIVTSPVGYMTPLPFGLGTFGMNGAPNGRGYAPASIRVGYTAGFLKTLDCLATTTEGSNIVALTPRPDKTVTNVLADVKTGFRVRIGTDEQTYRVARVSASSVTLDEAMTTTQADVDVVSYMYEPLLLETAALQAAIPILETIAGWVYGGPGVAGKNLSVDRMAQGKGYAATAGKSVYNALETVYQDRVDANIAAILRRFERPRVFAI